MGDEQYRDFAFAQFLELAHAAIGEHRVADGQGFVNDQDFGVHVDGGGEGQPDIHAARIFLHRTRDELADLREGFDRRHGALDFGAAESHDFAVQEDVFAARKFRIETGAQLQQRRDTAARDYASLGGLQNASNNL